MKDIEKALKPSRDTWFKRAMRLFDRPAVDESVWAELEELLISADVGVSTTEKLIERVKQRERRRKLARLIGASICLRQRWSKCLRLMLRRQVPVSVPRVILVVGVNGGGKTTSIAKLAYRAKKEGKRVILAAADTFRAAAIDQLKSWGRRLVLMLLLTSPGLMPGRWSLMLCRRRAVGRLMR